MKETSSILKVVGAGVIALILLFLGRGTCENTDTSLIS